MKILSILLGAGLAFGLGFGAQAQKVNYKDVPAQVSKAFEKKFPNLELRLTDWETNAARDEYEVEFPYEGKKMEATFAKDGAWKETETRISNEQAPAGMLQYIKTNYPKYKVEKIEALETPQGNFFEVEIEKGEDGLEVTFDKAGKFVKEAKEVKEDK